MSKAEQFHNLLNNFMFSSICSPDDGIFSFCQENKDILYNYAKDLFNNTNKDNIETCVLLLNNTFLEEYDKIKDKTNLNEVLNYWYCFFNNLNETDYFDYYLDYKKYLTENYIGWNPFKENDPNPTYEEYKKINNIK